MTGSDDLIPGQPLPDPEVWLRELINKGHAKNGTVHYQALKGRALAPPQQPRPWSYEISGRARSKAGDIRAHSEATLEKARENALQKQGVVPSFLQFAGAAFARVSDLRSSPDRPAGLDAIFTPNDDDAHSDVVMFGALTEEDLDRIRDWLLEKLCFATADQLDLIASI